MNNADSKNYILVTACKNEAENLPNLVESILKQSIRPCLWLIVDDGSTDATPKIIEEYSIIHKWIKHLVLTENVGHDRGIHLATVVKYGFDNVFEICKKQSIECSYFGNLDADLTLDDSYYEKLIFQFESNCDLGIVSGSTFYTIKDQSVLANISHDEPSGGNMLIRKECLEECGGIPLSYSFDSVLKAKAKIRGWRVLRFNNIFARETRDVGSVGGYWNGYCNKGKAAYYLNYNPFHVLGKFFLYCLYYPYYTSLAYLGSYLYNFILMNEQINDSEVKDFFWKKWRYNLINRTRRE